MASNGTVIQIMYMHRIVSANAILLTLAVPMCHAQEGRKVLRNPDALLSRSGEAHESLGSREDKGSRCC